MFTWLIKSYNEDGLFTVRVAADSYLQLQGIASWCWKTYGPEGGRWNHGKYVGDFVFLDEKDLSIFLLKWS